MCTVSLAATDLLTFAAASVFVIAGRTEPSVTIGPFAFFFHRALSIDLFAILAVAFVVLRMLAGDYSRREPFWDGVRGIAGGLFIVALPAFATLALKSGHYGVMHQIAAWLFLALAIPAMRQGTRYLLASMGLWQRRTALIGCGAEAVKAFEAISRSLALGFDIQWLVVPEHATEIPEPLSRLKRIASGNSSEAGLLVEAAGCAQAIVAFSDAEQGGFSDLVHRLSESSVGTAIVPPLSKLPLSNMSSSVMFGRNILLFQVRDNLRRWPQRVIKRGFDVAGATFGLIVLSPLFVVLGVMVKRQDGGPATYAQTRIGRSGVPFRCIKFRTMTRNADEMLARWQTENPGLYEEYQKAYKLRDDPRITPLGKWLRRTSLDELPQLVNILYGDMSFVGPRPVVERELIEFYGPAAQLYMRVRPGLTGLWQVSGRNNTTYEERIALDEWYVLNWSFWYDLIIIAQTFGAMVSGDGAY